VDEWEGYATRHVKVMDRIGHQPDILLYYEGYGF